MCTGPECSYSFLHLTLEEYLTALHIAIVNPSGFELVEWLKEDSVVVRFLAGMCTNDNYPRPVYQELVEQLTSNIFSVLTTHPIQLVHCAYECPSIMECIKVEYSAKNNVINVSPAVGLDWYETGFCISHFDERWGLDIDDTWEEGIDLLLKGCRSSPIAKGGIWYLGMWSSSLSLHLTIAQLSDFCQLHNLVIIDVSVGHDDEVALQQLITPESKLRKLEYGSIHTTETCTETFISNLFQQSSLQELTLKVKDDTIVGTNFLPQSNTNLTKLIISSNLLQLLATLIMNITSLTRLDIDGLLDSDLPVLINIVQSHCTLEILQVDDRSVYNDSTDIFMNLLEPKTETTDSLADASSDISANMLQLIEVAGKSHLKKLQLPISIYENLPPHIEERYEYLLEPIEEEY